MAGDEGKGRWRGEKERGGGWGRREGEVAEGVEKWGRGDFKVDGMDGAE